MTKVSMTLTQGHCQRSRSNFPKNGQKTKELVISWSLAISPTDFLPGTKVQPYKVHSMTQVSMTLFQGQG